MYILTSGVIINLLQLNTSGCSAAGSALRSGRRSREFESRHSDQLKEPPTFENWRFFIGETRGTRTPNRQIRSELVYIDFSTVRGFVPLHLPLYILYVFFNHINAVEVHFSVFVQESNTNIKSVSIIFIFFCKMRHDIPSLFNRFFLIIEYVCIYA